MSCASKVQLPICTGRFDEERIPIEKGEVGNLP
jgi:hypothetical protein